MAYPTTLKFNLKSPIPGLQPIDVTSTTQNHPLGLIVQAEEVGIGYGAGEYIYLPGCADTAKGDAVIYDNYTPATTRAVHTTAARGSLAVAMSDNVASQYGWYQISGAAVVKSGTVIAGNPVYLTSTASQVDDAVVSTDKVEGAVFLHADGTPSAGYAVVQLSRPACDGNG